MYGLLNLLVHFDSLILTTTSIMRIVICNKRNDNFSLDGVIKVTQISQLASGQGRNRNKEFSCQSLALIPPSFPLLSPSTFEVLWMIFPNRETLLYICTEFKKF